MSSELSTGESGSKDEKGVPSEVDELKQQLRESFKRVHDHSDKLSQELLLEWEAKQQNMEVAEYRHLYGLSLKPPTRLRRFWQWTGIPEKKGLDIITGISIPLLVFVGGGLFTYFNNQQQENIADNKQKDEVLKNYLDNMKLLLLDEKNPLKKSKKGDESRSIARALTLNTLSQLNKNKQEIISGNNQRKGFVIQFLSESGLTSRRTETSGPSPIVSLNYADLDKVNLPNADLSGADLEGALLNGAYLYGANLSGARNLTMTQLQGAKLCNTTLPDGKVINRDCKK